MAMFKFNEGIYSDEVWSSFERDDEDEGGEYDEYDRADEICRSMREEPWLYD